MHFRFACYRNPGLASLPCCMPRLLRSGPCAGRTRSIWFDSALACFGTGKLGGLATYASAIVCAMIAPLISDNRGERLPHFGSVSA